MRMLSTAEAGSCMLQPLIFITDMAFLAQPYDKDVPNYIDPHGIICPSLYESIVYLVSWSRTS